MKSNTFLSFLCFSFFLIGISWAEVAVETGKNETSFFEETKLKLENAIEENPYLVFGAGSITLLVAFLGYRFLFGEVCFSFI